MRRLVSLLVTLSLVGAVLAGCTSSGPAPAPDQTKAPAPAPAAGETKGPAPAVSPCTASPSAADLPSAPYGGITLPPAPPSATAEHPRLDYLTISQVEEWEGGGGVVGDVYIRKSGTATVDTGAVGLRGSVWPVVPDAWFETHLQVEGVTPDHRNIGRIGDQGFFQFRIPPGRPGDTFRVTLKDVVGDDGARGDVTVTFCRQTAPRATVSYKTKDGWMHTRDMVPGTAPLVLRVTFTSDMFKETVERALKGPHDKQDRSDGDWISSLTWVDSRTVELVADQVRPVMRLNSQGAQSTNGLYVIGGLPTLYAGEPPRVVAVDPASGQSRNLAELPPEPAGHLLSPDGRWLRATSRQIWAGRPAPEWDTRLIDLTTGTARPLKADELWGEWLPSGEVLRIRREGVDSLLLTRQSPAGGQGGETLLNDLKRLDSYKLSPDGKWLAALVGSDAAPSYPNVGVRLVMLSTDGKSRQAVKGDLQVYRPGKDGIMLYGPAWSPDSTRLALTVPGSDGATSLVVADLTTGTLRTLTPALQSVRWGFDPVVWSPDGRQILAGAALVDAATGNVVRRMEGLKGLPRFSPDGQWLLWQEWAWEPITLYNLKTGASTGLGEGLVLGWNAEGKALLMRWPDAAHRAAWGI